jgi:hypothetical protein
LFTLSSSYLTSQDIEDEIKNIEAIGKPSDFQKARLAEIKAELERINRKKAEYVQEHPEHRRLVYRVRRDDEPAEDFVPATRKLFNKKGMPRHPERSVFYHPIFNKSGVAPPGELYRERRESAVLFLELFLII